MNYKELRNFIIENGLIVGFITFFLSFITIFYWQYNGFEEFELILLSLITSFYLFIVNTIYSYFIFNRFYKNIESPKKPKRRYLIAMVIFASIILIILLDSLVFFIDDSVSIEYLNYLNSLDESNAEEETLLPMNILNIVQIFIFGFLSYVLLALMVKKNV